jgi:hypothetical protein
MSLPWNRKGLKNPKMSSAAWPILQTNMGRGFMKPPEEIKGEFPHEWLRKAEINFKTARHLYQGGPDFAGGSAFHSQQAAEKYLKAFLV